MVKDSFVELNLVDEREEVLKWGAENYPEHKENHNLLAQLYYVIKKGNLKLPEPVMLTTVAELRERVKKMIETGDVTTPEGKPKKAWASIEVLVSGPLNDSAPYFGCPSCISGVDKNIGVCVNETAHPGQRFDGEMLSWQNYQAWDEDSVIISFPPNQRQKAELIVGSVLTLRGGMDLRNGRFSVWEIVSNKRGKPLRGLEKKIIPKEVEKDDKSTESDDKEYAPEDTDISAFIDVGEEEKRDVGRAGTDLIEKYDSFVNTFMRGISKFPPEKPAPLQNVVSWLLVQPEVRHISDVELRKGVIESFLDEQEKKGVITITNDKLSSVGE